VEGELRGMRVLGGVMWYKCGGKERERERRGFKKEREGMTRMMQQKRGFSCCKWRWVREH